MNEIIFVFYLSYFESKKISIKTFHLFTDVGIVQSKMNLSNDVSLRMGYLTLTVGWYFLKWIVFWIDLTIYKRFDRE